MEGRITHLLGGPIPECRSRMIRRLSSGRTFQPGQTPRMRPLRPEKSAPSKHTPDVNSNSSVTLKGVAERHGGRAAVTSAATVAHAAPRAPRPKVNMSSGSRSALSEHAITAAFRGILASPRPRKTPCRKEQGGIPAKTSHGCMLRRSARVSSAQHKVDHAWGIQHNAGRMRRFHRTTCLGHEQHSCHRRTPRPRLQEFCEAQPCECPVAPPCRPCLRRYVQALQCRCGEYSHLGPRHTQRTTRPAPMPAALAVCHR